MLHKNMQDMQVELKNIINIFIRRLLAKRSIIEKIENIAI
jgi:hypothetical protein